MFIMKMTQREKEYKRKLYLHEEKSPGSSYF